MGAFRPAGRRFRCIELSLEYELVLPKSSNSRPHGLSVTIWSGLRTRVRFRVPPPLTKDKPVSLGSFSGVTGFLFPLVSKGFAPVSHLSKAPLRTIDSPHLPAILSLFAPRFSVFSGPSPKLVLKATSLIDMGFRNIAVLGGCLRSSFDAPTGRIFRNSLPRR